MTTFQNGISGCPCHKDPSRVDPFGRAYAGSQRQIQTYVNDRADELSRAAIECLSLSSSALVQWVSPLRQDGYTEYRDSDFLQVLGLAHLGGQLRNFWPFGGPCWDALARIGGNVRHGVILAEAKSHITEIYGNGCGAAGRSLMQIQVALNSTKKWLGVGSDADWTGSLYQSANRYAHLYFLREIAGVEAYLINVYFIGDPHSPTRMEEWEPEIERVYRQLEIASPIPFTATLFANAGD